jgi:nucleoside-diphosphate-sugar epimerase
MRILVTGANGFVARHLIERLSAQGGLGGAHEPYELLTLVDLHFDGILVDPRIRLVEGSLTESKVIEQAVHPAVDLVFHLACVAGRTSENDYNLGREVNLYSAIYLLDALRAQSQPPRFIFSSSVSVFGTPFPKQVDDETLPLPSLSYGSQKLMVETLVNDYTRRGWIDGLSVRLSGIVTRPTGSASHLFLFVSEAMRAAKAGRSFTLPMGPDVSTWLMSLPCCVDNLMHAATIPSGDLPARRAWTLPALHISMSALINGLAEVYGEEVKHRFAYSPDSGLERLFGQPPLMTAMADRLGFKNDRDAITLISRSMSVCS